ncbi:MAG: nitrile hydratase subunit beta [Alphaproteobacteria bacterium]|nr:nitrile hydratase subunit beta [Alphaproteobacteria bacterium]
MNSLHDMAGMDGMGPIPIEENEPVFHADWEKQVHSVARALMGRKHFNTDEFRHSMERIEASRYLQLSYYERWLEGITTLLLEKGVITQQEFDTRSADQGGGTKPAADREMVRNMYKIAGSVRLRLDVAPRFKAGDRIVARNISPPGHTRLPRYIRGKRGVVEHDHGVFHFPDTRVAGQGDQPQHMYTVGFVAREVWGEEAPANDSLRITLWDDYMVPA